MTTKKSLVELDIVKDCLNLKSQQQSHVN